MSKHLNITRLLAQRRLANPDPPPRRAVAPKIEKRTYAVEKRAIRRPGVE